MPNKSPGGGITPIPFSADPLATEGEATPGPDGVNPYDLEEYERAKAQGSSQFAFEPADPPPTEDPDLPPLTRGPPLDWPTF
jgi:hypothetical protein